MSINGITYVDHSTQRVAGATRPIPKMCKGIAFLAFPRYIIITLRPELLYISSNVHDISTITKEPGVLRCAVEHDTLLHSEEVLGAPLDSQQIVLRMFLLPIVLPTEKELNETMKVPKCVVSWYGCDTIYTILLAGKLEPKDKVVRDRCRSRKITRHEGLVATEGI